MAAAVAGPLDGPSPLDTTPGDEDDSRVLGASTADQVFEQWKVFLETSSKNLRERSLCQGENHQLPATGPATFKSGGASPDSSSPAEKLGLYDSAAGQAATFVSTLVREARACAVSARGLFRHLALFGERQTAVPVM
mmetsp:Transcript_47635/g.153166  ORF Transcript_47635/g.153166 Transcript_47635/m.153166 type:complete len:137 (+) Transcript_47635:360-770(+)